MTGPRPRAWLPALVLTVLMGGVARDAGASEAPAPAAAAPARPAAASAAAVETPAARATTFAGHWRLDVARSEHGKSRRVPKTREDVITADGAWLSVKSVSVREGNDTLRLDYRYRIDGDAMNTVMGQEVKTRGRFSDGVLQLDSEAKFLMVSLFVNEHWVLSADGRSLIIERTSRSPLGDDRQKLVFVRH